VKSFLKRKKGKREEEEEKKIFTIKNFKKILFPKKV
jgi:hypothetical protein